MAALLMSVLLAAAALAAGATAIDRPAVIDVLADVNAVRTTLCPGDMRRAALQRSARLNDAAAHVARGAKPHDALDAAGYTARRMASIDLQGYSDDAQVRQILAKSYCSVIADLGFHDIGFGWNKDRLSLILASERHVAGDAAVVSARVLKLVNDARSQPRRCGSQSFRAAQPLTLNAQLERAALQHSQEMAKYSYMEHEGRDGSTPAQRVARAGYQWTEVAENVAAGQETPDDVMTSWLASAGHCANIMNAKFTEIGVASAVNARDDYGVYWTMSLASPR
jgi:uncharacterized protein YkwD